MWDWCEGELSEFCVFLNCEGDRECWEGGLLPMPP